MPTIEDIANDINRAHAEMWADRDRIRELLRALMRQFVSVGVQSESGEHLHRYRIALDFTVPQNDVESALAEWIKRGEANDARPTPAGEPPHPERTEK